MRDHRFLLLPSLLVLFLTSLFTGSARSAQRPQPESFGEDEPDLGRLARAAETLFDGEASNRFAGLHEIVHRAARGPRMPAELQVLLRQASRDPVPEIARLASLALDNRAQSTEVDDTEDKGGDERIRALADARRLEWAGAELARLEPGRSANHRLVAVQILAHLAGKELPRSSDLERHLQYAVHDENPEVSRLAEQVLSRIEAASVDATSVGVAARQTPRRAPAILQDGAAAIYESVEDGNPDVRLTALQWVVDVALSEGIDSDPRILVALTGHVVDPDPRVAHFARSSLEGLDCSDGALREVFVAGEAGGDDGFTDQRECARRKRR